jgi:hypothetical protein
VRRLAAAVCRPASPDVLHSRAIAAILWRSGHNCRRPCLVGDCPAGAHPFLGNRSIATYATDNATPKLPFWQMVFKNIRVYFLGSDDFPREAKMQAARDINSALEAGWTGFQIGERIPLAEIARAHELVDHPAHRGRVVVIL